MKTRRVIAALLAGMMIAGCSASQPSQNDANTGKETTENNTQNSTEPALIKALIDASGDDSQALNAWNAIFTQTAKSYSGNYTVGGDGEVYLYTEDNAGMVDDHTQYDVSRNCVMRTENGQTDLIDLTDIDDSYETLIQGFGYIGAVGNDSAGASVKLDQTDDDSLKGTINKVYEGDQPDMDKAAADNIMDAMTNFGYVRTVDPIHDASLYKWNLEQKGSNYVVTLNVKDLDAFKKKAALKEVLIDNRTDAPVLAMDEITGETWTYTFDNQGNLKESENTVYHVLTAMDLKSYMNLHNEADIEAAESDDLRMDALTDFIAGVKDGSLKEGSAFTITNWE